MPARSSRKPTPARPTLLDEPLPPRKAAQARLDKTAQPPHRRREAASLLEDALLGMPLNELSGTPAEIEAASSRLRELLRQTAEGMEFVHLRSVVQAAARVLRTGV